MMVIRTSGRKCSKGAWSDAKRQLRQLTQLRDRDDILTVGVSIPLFSRKQNLGNIEASVGRSRAAQLRKEYLTRTIPLEVDAAWRRLEGSRAALATLEGQAITLTQSNLEIRQAYELGQLRLLDVLPGPMSST